MQLKCSIRNIVTFLQYKSMLKGAFSFVVSFDNVMHKLKTAFLILVIFEKA